MLATHLMDRTSPKGGPFVGACRWCGTVGLIQLAQEGCVHAPVSQADNVMAAIGGALVACGCVGDCTVENDGPEHGKHCCCSCYCHDAEETQPVGRECKLPWWAG